jgi:hypothetical protein
MLLLAHTLSFLLISEGELQLLAAVSWVISITRGLIKILKIRSADFYKEVEED